MLVGGLPRYTKERAREVMSTLSQQKDLRGEYASRLISSLTQQPASNLALESEFLLYCLKNNTGVFKRQDALDLPLLQLVQQISAWSRYFASDDSVIA